jgi:hypothetical protein
MAPDELVVMALLFAGLVFHFVFCLAPSLRYFDARGSAYVIGAAAYALVAAFPIVDSLFGLSTAAFRAYVVLTLVILTVIAFRPYAFVRASGGPQPRTHGRGPVIEGTRESDTGSRSGDIPAR